jgi:hypothetical protein
MTRIIQRHDQSDVWFATNPVLQAGEVGWETDTRLSKIGNGVTPWNALSYTMANISVDKVDLGLDQVDNTSDVDKPVSSATQTALDNALAQVALTYATKAESNAALALKAPLASPAFTGNPTAPTPALADNDTSLATTAFVKSAIQDRLDVETFWYGGASATAEPASTTSGWTTFVQTPSESATDDSLNARYVACPGGVQIKKPGRYIVEFAIVITGGAAGVRFGLGIAPTSGTVQPAGGSPGAGYQLDTPAAAGGNYYSLTRPFVVLAGPVNLVAMYYCQTTTSHTGQITRISVNRIG